MEFPDGLYDLILSQAQAGKLALETEEGSRTLVPLHPDESAERLADAVARQLVEILDDISGDGKEKIERQLELVNDILVETRRRLGQAADTAEKVATPIQLLQSVHRHTPTPAFPDTGLAVPWLFTAGKGTPSLLHELIRELAACDRVDILVSFITLAGVRKLSDVLQSITSVGGDGQARTQIRVLTTTYMGATEATALDELAKLPGCKIKISLDGRRTRLHAKAWLFHRRSGFGAAYVGSANLSGAALLGGLEWTVKITERGQVGLFERAKAHFETLWEDSEFQAYDTNNPVHRSALKEALKQESGDNLVALPTFFDLQPKIYQQEMLDQLAIEREHGRTRNLVVAATGTGKTVVAAFDYRRICQVEGGRPKLLFVAHRQEILKQALRTFREVLRDNTFGELLADGAQLDQFNHVFATIDSVVSRNLVDKCGADHWHTVVIDECHRLAADRFTVFANSVKPKILLGLTATPERSDGKPILPFFDCRPDGSPAVEMRLWNALELQLLSPFEYFACDDETDFSDVPWDRPGEVEAVSNLVTGNEVRARLVLNEWRRLTGDPTRGRALVFCVSVAHAEYMAAFLNKAGIPALCVLGTTPQDERRRAPEMLQSGKVCALVTCDLYNEGVDLPSVDTLLLLRPTQSPVLFQQQIGRGLRLYLGKDSCLVLDFVGRHRVEFRFDRLLGSITGLSKRELLNSVEMGFGNLPAGCHIQLQRQARDQVLASLRASVQQNWRRLRTELQAFATLRGRNNISLAAFLHDQSIDLEDIYRDSARSGWTNLKRDAGLLTSQADPNEEYLSRRFGDLLHVDDFDRINTLMKVAESGARYEPQSECERLLLQMLAYQIDAQHHQFGTGEEFAARVQSSPDIRAELGELAGQLAAKSPMARRPTPGLEDTPISLHASYTAREILTSVGWLRPDRRVPFQAGVLPLHDRKTELLFVTLDKSEGYHDRIAYRDYAISAERFHWQSQNAAGPNTAGGRRYLESPANGWKFQLFVRSKKADPYRVCGPVSLESVEGNRPMTVYWRMTIPLSLRLLQEFSVLRAH